MTAQTPEIQSATQTFPNPMCRQRKPKVWTGRSAMSFNLALTFFSSFRSLNSTFRNPALTSGCPCQGPKICHKARADTTRTGRRNAAPRPVFDVSYDVPNTRQNHAPDLIENDLRTSRGIAKRTTLPATITDRSSCIHRASGPPVHRMRMVFRMRENSCH